MRVDPAAAGSSSQACMKRQLGWCLKLAPAGPLAPSFPPADCPPCLTVTTAATGPAPPRGTMGAAAEATVAARGENEDRVAPSSAAGRGAAGAAAAALKHGPRARRSGCRRAHWGVAVSPRAEQRPPRPAIVAGARSACPECPLGPRRLRQMARAGELRGASRRTAAGQYSSCWGRAAAAATPGTACRSLLKLKFQTSA